MNSNNTNTDLFELVERLVEHDMVPRLFSELVGKATEEEREDALELISCAKWNNLGENIVSVYWPHIQQKQKQKKNALLILHGNDMRYFEIDSSQLQKYRNMLTELNGLTLNISCLSKREDQLFEIFASLIEGEWEKDEITVKELLKKQFMEQYSIGWV
jgi:hypothetical protein